MPPPERGMKPLCELGHEINRFVLVWTTVNINQGWTSFRKWQEACSHYHTNHYEMPIDWFTIQIYGCFFSRDLVTSHFINLYLTMVFQYLESTLHTLVVAMSDKPWASKLSGCQEQSLIKRHAKYLNMLVNQSIGTKLHGTTYIHYVSVESQKAVYIHCSMMFHW